MLRIGDYRILLHFNVYRHTKLVLKQYVKQCINHSTQNLKHMLPNKSYSYCFTMLEFRLRIRIPQGISILYYHYGPL